MTMTPRQFVSEYKPYAEQTEAKTGISAKFILAQSALETGWGKSAPGNMMFGVKASKSTPADKRQLVTTREVLSRPDYDFPEVISITKRSDGKYTYKVKDWFRKYDTPEESFTDHANFYLSNRRYNKALSYREDPRRFADEIAKAGYATDPNYARILKQVIDTIERNYA